LPDLDEVRSKAATLFNPDVDLGPSIDLRADAQRSLLGDLAQLYDGFPWNQKPLEEYRFHLDQTHFRYGDALILYSMLRFLKPQRVIEVGSGFSSALMLDTNDSFLDGTVRFTFIEPFPARLEALLREKDRKTARILVDFVQNVPISVFRELETKDILFIDSSHVSKIGSDVNFLVFNVLPALNPAVVIHFHDVHWPFEYPQQSVIDGRAWNEAYLVRAFLQYNRCFEILLFNSFVAHAFQSLVEDKTPIFMVFCLRLCCDRGDAGFVPAPKIWRKRPHANP